MGASYCVATSPARHACSLFAEEPELVAAENAGYWYNNRVGRVLRPAGNPKPAFFDDGTHPACLCYDESDTSYGCNCDPASFAPFPDVPSDNTWGCSGHGQCASLSYQCHCDEGYGWSWQDAQNGHGSGFTCVACPAGTYKSADMDKCTACPPGTYQPDTGSSACESCAPISASDVASGTTPASIPVNIVNCSADSEHDADHACENAYDGDTGTDWAILGTNYGGVGFAGADQGWIQFEFEQSVTVSSFRYVQRESGGDKVRSARLSFSDGTFQDVSFDPSQTETTTNIVPTRTSYVRFKILTATYTQYNPGIKEIQFFLAANVASIASCDAHSEYLFFVCEMAYDGLAYTSWAVQSMSIFSQYGWKDLGTGRPRLRSTDPAAVHQVYIENRQRYQRQNLPSAPQFRRRSARGNLFVAGPVRRRVHAERHPRHPVRALRYYRRLGQPGQPGYLRN